LQDFEFELGVAKDSKPLKNRSSWLTAHLFIHILLIALSHTDRQSTLVPVTALISQAILFVLFMQAKRLADNVSNAVSVVRRASRVIGTQVNRPPPRWFMTSPLVPNRKLFLVEIKLAHSLSTGACVLHEAPRRPPSLAIA
jgi:hypothetical protein